MNDLTSTTNITDQGLMLENGHQASICLPWTWLRDHCHASHSLSPKTGQKVHTPAEVLGQAPARAVRFDSDGNLHVTWPGGGPASYYPRDFLDRFATGAPSAAATYAEPVTWAVSELPARLLRGIEAEAFLDRDAPSYREFLGDFAQYGFGLLRNVPCTVKATEALANRIAFVGRTFYGDLGVIEARADAPADTAWSNAALGPHTDGTYFDKPPGLQALHCLAHDCTGGESTLVDGFRIAETLKAKAPALYAKLCETTIPARYIDEARHYETDIQVLRHEGGRLVQVQYNCYDRAPFAPDEDTETLYRALTRFQELACAPEYALEFQLREGDAVIFDNWRLLHGRRAFAGRTRKLASFYIERDAYRSALRMATGLTIT